MNIVFMGTPGFAVPSLHAILNSHHNLQAVVTVPDKHKGRGLNLGESEVKQYSLQHNLKLLQPEKMKDPDFISALKDINPDLIIVVAFRILPAEVFTLPKFGSVNLHASLLPKYRGAAPINWAIIRGEKQTGVTTFFLKEKVDTGSIIMQESVPIYDNDDAGTMHDKLMLKGSETLMKTIELIDANNGIVPVVLQDEKNLTPAPKIFKEDCNIHWELNAINVHNLVRGLSPYPAAFTHYKNKIVKIYRTALTDVESLNGACEIIVIKNDMFVSCSDFLLKIEELQPEGKRRMTTVEFLAGNKFQKGDKFMYLQL